MRVDPKVVNQSVQQQNTSDHFGVSSLWFNPFSPADDLLPSWGSKARDIRLRQYWLLSHGTLVQGSISNLVKRITATPWEVSGGRNLSRRYQEILQNAEFGQGWKDFWTRVLTDYFTQDFGGVIEVIGAGSPDKPLRGGVTGLAHLDRQRCLATGDPEYPIVYYNDVIDVRGRKKSSVHRMHHTRVIRLTDMVSPIERSYGNGLCALSRAISVVNAQVLMGRYQNEKLSNAPPVGLIAFGNVKPGDVNLFREQYAADRQRDGSNTYPGILEMQSVDPANPIEIEFIPFAQLPDSFNYKEYMEAHVNMLALALGEDPQEIWPLTGQALGTGTQSKVLHAKGRAKAYADVLKMIERLLNLWVLPESLDFNFKFTDSERDKEEAETAQLWVSVINAAPISNEQKLSMMANRIPAFADVLLDEAGNLRLPDDDVTEETTADDDHTLEATETAETEEDGADTAASADDTEKRLGRGGHLVRPAAGEVRDTAGLALDLERREIHSKDYLNTQAEFVRNLTDLINAGMNGDITRRRFGTVLRGQLARLGRRAYQDGLEEGGVDVGEDGMGEDDLSAIAVILAEQSGYVTNFADRIFDGTQVNAESRAMLWAHKSLDRFFMAGLSSADSNGMYEFTGEDGEESCATCQRLKGQRHRLKDWTKKKLRPGVDTEAFECGGWRCAHILRRTTERAYGRF